MTMIRRILVGSVRSVAVRLTSLRVGALVRWILLAAAINAMAIERSASAADAGVYVSKAKEYLETLGNKTVSLLSDNTKSQAKKKREIEDLMDSEIDFELVSKYVLGEYWKRVPPRQRPEYHDLFRRLEISTLSRLLLKYPVKGFEITDATSEGGHDILMQTKIYRLDAEPFQPTWRLRRSKEGFKIIDLHYEGISLARTRRQEFASVLKEGGFDGLMVQLKQNLKQSNQQ